VVSNLNVVTQLWKGNIISASLQRFTAKSSLQSWKTARLSHLYTTKISI